mgnify:CR=1 FL=1
MAKVNYLPIPDSWKVNKEAEHERYLGFMSRNRYLSQWPLIRGGKVDHALPQ